MAQVKVFALESALAGRQLEISDAVHAAVVEALSLPIEKRFHRFLPLSSDNFFYPADRSEQYLILEISMFDGRAVETKKALIRSLFFQLSQIGFEPQDVEITITETPRHNWGIRGQCGDEIGLNYSVEV